MSFERSYSIESHERIKLILIFGDKSLLLTWWVTYICSEFFLCFVFQFTVVASSTFSSSSTPLNKKLDFDKSPVLPKEPNNNVASSVNANFVNKPLETKPINLLKGDFASVNQILESTSGKQLQPLLAMTSSTASPSLSPSTSFHGQPDLEVSTSMDNSFADVISKSIAQNIIMKNRGVSYGCFLALLVEGHAYAVYVLIRCILLPKHLLCTTSFQHGFGYCSKLVVCQDDVIQVSY